MNRTNKNIYSLAASVAFVTFLVYLPALRNEFVYWDDNLYLFENQFIRSLDATFFRRAFLGFHISNWHPLTWISHALDYALWGLNPFGHHLTSIILHAVNTALVVVLALKLFETVRERTQQNASASFLNDRTTLIAAGVTGLLFGIHPVHVESVAWVAERKDLLCALFFLLSIMAYVKAVSGMGHGAEGNKLPLRALLTALCFFILALMSKPMAVSLPLVLLILDWYPFGRVRSWKTLWPSGVEKLPFFVLSLASSVMTILAQRAGEAIISVEQITLPERALVAAKALIAYPGKMLLPINLIPFYPYPKVVPLFSFEYLSALALFIGITAACVVLAKKQKFWMSAWGYYIVTLIPVLGIIQVGAQSMADRYTYLPSISLFLLAGLGVAWIVKRTFVIRQHAGLKIVFGMVLSCVLVFLCYATFKQISIWQNSISLWSYVIEKEPGTVSLAYSQRGIVFGKEGQTEQAIADLETAIALNPYNYDAYMNLAVAFHKLGQSDRARANVEKAIQVRPSSHEAYVYRGVLYEETGQFDKAIADYTRAIALDDADSEAYNDRGIAFGKSGRYDEAIADYNQAIRINPRSIDAYSNRGVAYALTGQNDRALEDFTTAIRLGPSDPMTYLNRGSLYRRIGRNDPALADFQMACDLGNEKSCGILHQLTQGVHPR